MTELFVDPNHNREGYEFNMDSQRWEKVEVKNLEKLMEEMAKAPREEKPGTPTQG